MLSYDNLDQDQLDAINFICSGEDALLCADVGTGKTVISYTAAQRKLESKEIKLWIVLAPLMVCNDAWQYEPSEWEHLQNLRVGVATGGQQNCVKQCERATRGEIDFLVVNYENLDWLLMNHRNLMIDRAGLICDEIDKLKSVSTQRFKAFRNVIPQFASRIGLTGTVTPNKLEEIWGPVFVVDGGETLGRSFYKWREQNFFPTDYQQYNWMPFPGYREKLVEQLRGLVFRLEGKGLPEVVFCNPVVVPMPDELSVIYNRLERDSFLDMGKNGVINAENQGILHGKLRQLCAGFSYVYDESILDRKERMKTREVVWHSTNKFHALEKMLIDFQHQQEQVLIFYHFEEEYAELERRFGIPRMKGQNKTSTDLKNQWNAGTLPVMALHPASAGHGLNLQKSGAHHQIFLSLPESGGLMKQSIGRLARRGQSAPMVFVHSLVFQHTLDDVVMTKVQNRIGQLAELHDDFLDVTLDMRGG